MKELQQLQIQDEALLIKHVLFQCISGWLHTKLCIDQSDPHQIQRFPNITSVKAIFVGHGTSAHE
jgi:hypothetical protein